MDQQMLQNLQGMGINPYQFQMFLQSPQGMQITQECQQYMINSYNQYMQSVQQNIAQTPQNMGMPGKSDVPNEEVEQLKAQNQALETQLQETNKSIEELKEMLISNQKGGKNENK